MGLFRQKVIPAFNTYRMDVDIQANYYSGKQILLASVLER